MAYHKKDKYRSIVDEYDKDCNSFDAYLNAYDKSYLYPMIINRNYEAYQRFPISFNEKIKFENDYLKTDFYTLSSERLRDIELPNNYLHLFMQGCNPFYYTYLGEEKEYVVRIYSPIGLKIMLDFVNSCSDFSLNINPDTVQGYIDFVSIEKAGRRTRYRQPKSNSYFANIFLFKNSLTIKSNSLNYKIEADTVSRYSMLPVNSMHLFIFALMKLILDATGKETSGLSLREYSKILTEKDLFDEFISKIELNYKGFNDVVKNACSFFSPTFGYVFDKLRYDSYLDAKICALANEVTHHYDYEILNFNLFKQSHWKNKTFDKFVISAMQTLCENKNKSRWYNHTGTLRMEYLKALLFLNWCYYPNKVAKSATAVWLYYVLNNNLKESFVRDKIFYKTIIAYLLQKNDLTFKQIINELSTSVSSSKIDDIYYSIITYFSDGFEFSINKYTYNQKKLLSRNVKKSLGWDVLKSRHLNDGNNEQLILTGKAWAKKVYDFVSSMLEDPNYTNQKIVDLVDCMPDYPKPYVYSDVRTYNTTPSYGPNYEGSYVRDSLGWTKDEIDTILDGNPDAYWNID